MTYEHSDLPNRLKRAREHAQLTQTQMANRLNVSRHTIMRYEAKTNQIPIIPFNIIVGYSMMTGANFTYLVLGEKPLNGALNRIEIARQFLDNNFERLSDDYIKHYGPPE